MIDREFFLRSGVNMSCSLRGRLLAALILSLFCVLPGRARAVETSGDCDGWSAMADATEQGVFIEATVTLERLDGNNFVVEDTASTTQFAEGGAGDVLL